MRIARPAKLSGQMAHYGLLAVASISSAALIGCAQLDRAIQPPPVNPSSPIAPYAEEVSRENFATPTFSQVPPKPKDVPSAHAYKLAVGREVALREELAAWRAAHPDLPSDVDAWADLQRHRIPAGAAAPVSTTQDAESEAFAKHLREEAAKSQPQQ